MSDSLRFIAYGDLYDKDDKPVTTGPFYIKNENGWQIYVVDGDKSTGWFGDSGFPVHNFLIAGNLKVTITEDDYRNNGGHILENLWAIASDKNFVLKNIKWVGDLTGWVHHKHIVCKGPKV